MVLMDPIERADHEIRSLARKKDYFGISWSPARRALLEAANRLLQLCDFDSPPVDLKPIRKYRGINRIEFCGSEDCPEATLIPEYGGFLLRLKSGFNKTRYRFTVAHEIGHTFFYDRSSEIPTRFAVWDHERRLRLREEELCNAFARELLIPRGCRCLETVRSSQTHQSLSQIVQLAKTFGVSLEVMTLRLMHDLSTYSNSIAIVCEYSMQTTPHLGAQPRRHRGSNLAHHVRKSEMQFLETVTDAASNHDLDSLAKISNSNDRSHKVEWRLYGLGKQRTLFILLHFVRTSPIRKHRSRRIKRPGNN